MSASPMRPAVPSLRPCGVPGCTIRHRPESDPEPREDGDRLDRGFLVAVAFGWLAVGIVWLGDLLGWWTP